jgi:AcrR family transcriptional regulator
MVPPDEALPALAGLSIEPAPRRGTYDRGASRSDRHAEQRIRVLLAACAAFAEHGSRTTVAHIIGKAKIGRNTFYESYDDAAHALSVAARGVARHVSNELSRVAHAHRTPIARLRAVCEAWFEWVEKNPALAAVVFGISERGNTAAYSVVEGALDEVMRASERDRVFGHAAHSLRKAAVSGAIVCLSLRVHERSCERPRAFETAFEVAVTLLR